MHNAIAALIARIAAEWGLPVASECKEFLPPNRAFKMDVVVRAAGLAGRYLGFDVTRREGEIDVAISHDDDWVAVEVRDTGVGIPVERLTRVFDAPLAELERRWRAVREAMPRELDALIIQDVGLLECTLPPLPLVASTQMHNTTPEKVSFLEQVGFRRAIETAKGMKE